MFELFELMSVNQLTSVKYKWPIQCFITQRNI